MNPPDLFDLSFIVSTRNRLVQLQILFQELFARVSTGEEIVVVDGGSTDGSKEFLEELYRQGKIHQFISEPDRNQAQGWNKALLMARGTIVKKIIDDDVYCLSAIRKCAAEMLARPQIDALLSNDLGCYIGTSHQVDAYTRLPQYREWASGAVPAFTFGDVHLLIRRSALSLFGLYHPGFTMLDWEYSLRMSHLRAHIVYFTGYNALSVSHPGSVSSQLDVAAIREQTRRAEAFYNYRGDRSAMSSWSKVKVFMGKKMYGRRAAALPVLPVPADLPECYRNLYRYIDRLNEETEGAFLDECP